MPLALQCKVLLITATYLAFEQHIKKGFNVRCPYIGFDSYKVISTFVAYLSLKHTAQHFCDDKSWPKLAATCFEEESLVIYQAYTVS